MDGALLPTYSSALNSLLDSFKRAHDKKKRRYLWIAVSTAFFIEIGIYFATAWEGKSQEISFSAISVDLGDFKPRARRAPVIEVDEVFGNQFVKEKKEATAIPANEAGGSVDGEGVVDLDVEGTGTGGGAPNIARCALRNFPAEAKAYVEEALVPIQITVDKTGLVREAKPLFVQINKELPPELKSRMKSLFMKAARESLLGRKCPLYYVNGESKPYKLEVPLSYELYN
ncbi:MAG: hypothetical protein LDLANPLL_00076 [Turneriella sp.]|nr:hypothetical protein [Turneriella sp.]